MASKLQMLIFACDPCAHNDWSEIENLKRIVLEMHSIKYVIEKDISNYFQKCTNK